MNNKGFLDMGLVVVLVWGGILGTVAINEMTKDQKAVELCKKQGSMQIGDSLYQCRKLQTLGDPPKQKPCPKCPPPKIIKKQCNDDHKIFPLCTIIHSK